ncbi:glycerophosphodiester phosphodiesterase [Deinococcus sp. AJ005]|uniref:glycerophosphodiester phosphodiesterase n=1 Tax=Deinococcus sp. AJ005 TaxID=2652443 RepID=UPI00125CC149|nr:glycerophosphodiester phosphodiesterase [Deinococcus sp. AJ005]QFP78086.1 glycerophosphodiester phosphodiesterase [Deinococcus sp. AJ005]
MKKRGWAGAGLLTLGLLGGLGACSSGPAQTEGAQPNPLITGRVWNVAHQGGELLWPSNTMLAFHNAAALGADMLDTDMHATKDGVLVLSHDDTLDRLTNLKGKIEDMTLEQVQAADAGYTLSPDGGQTFPFRGQGVRVATLSEMLSGFPKMPLSIEIKQVTPSLGIPFCKALRDAGATARVVVSSFSDVAMGDFRTACPEVLTSMTEKELRPLVLLSKVGLSGLAPVPGKSAQVPMTGGGLTVVTPSFVKAMHRRGVSVQVWTINDEATMRRLIGMGVDGILTDDPVLLKRVLEEEKGAGK